MVYVRPGDSIVKNLKWFMAAMLIGVTGCSTAPLADFLDWVAPGRLPQGTGTREGGVCIPQGELPGANVETPAVVNPQPAPIGSLPVQPPGSPVPVPPPGGVIPPPAPIPPDGSGTKGPAVLPPAQGQPVPFPGQT